MLSNLNDGRVAGKRVFESHQLINQEKMSAEIFIGHSVSAHNVRFSRRGAVWMFCYWALLSCGSFRLSAEVQPSPSRIEEFTVRENDSTIYTLKLAYDQAGLPSYFFRNVFTPVCFTDVCKPVYIDIYWDLLGNYVRYEVPPDEPLTKADHEEFEEDDYKQLHAILSNESSILKDYSMYELVDSRTYNLSDSVDAVTGATPKTIKSEVIAGAVYTCYTLWHITNGPVVAEMRKITEQKHDAELVSHFLKSKNHHYQYWAVDKVISANGTVDERFMRDLLNIINGDNIFTAAYTLQKIPADYFSASESLQQWLWSAYQNGSYRLQMDILDKLQGITLSDELAVAMSGEMAHTNQEQFTAILGRLTAQDRLSEKVILNLLGHLNDPVRGPEVFDSLTGIQESYPAIRKRLKQYRKQ